MQVSYSAYWSYVTDPYHFKTQWTNLACRCPEGRCFHGNSDAGITVAKGELQEGLF